MAQLVRSNKALYDYCVAFGIPLISGKDSMKNDFYDGSTKISIPPTLLFSVIGKMDDVRKAITMDVKKAGDIVYILGETAAELGGSEYFAAKGFIGNKVPHVNAEKALSAYRAYHEAVLKGLVASCHDLSDGGLAVAAAESAFAGGFGISLNLETVPLLGNSALDEEAILFSESASRLLVTVNSDKAEAFESAMAGQPLGRIGVVTTDSTLTITGVSGKVVVKAGIAKLKEAWQSPLQSL